MFPYTQGKPKALLELAGKPMAQWVIDALTGVEQIEQLVLVGLGPQDGISSPKLDAFVSDHGGMLQNVIAGVDRLLEINPAAKHTVLCSADIPLITTAIMEEYLDQCLETPLDMNYGAVERSVMEARFPNSRRSFLRLTDRELAGADVSLINPEIVLTNRDLWDDLIAGRKNVFKQARRIGFVTLLLILLRRLSLAQAEKRVMKAMGLTGRVVLTKHAELAMDVDKPFQFEICQQELGD